MLERQPDNVSGNTRLGYQVNRKVSMLIGSAQGVSYSRGRVLFKEALVVCPVVVFETVQ